MKTTYGLSLLATSLISVLIVTTARAADITPAETKAIAEDGFVYGLPIVMNYAVMYEYCRRQNLRRSTRRPSTRSSTKRASSPTRTRPSSRPTAIRPIRLCGWTCAPSRSCSRSPRSKRSATTAVQLCDGNTYNFGYIGSRATGTDAGDYMVVGPDWKGETPPASRRCSVPARSSRPRLPHPALQRRKTCRMWSRSRPVTKCSRSRPISKQPAPPAAPAINFPKINKELVKTNFFDYLDFALQFAPAAPDDKEIRAKLGEHRHRSGKEIFLQDLSPEQQGRGGFRHEGRRQKSGEYRQQPARTSTAGGSAGLLGAIVAFFHGDWLNRAPWRQGRHLRQRRGRGDVSADPDGCAGQPLDGSQHNYTLTFAAEQFPPVNAFWSVTMYDGKTQLLIENPINRYLINSPMLPGMKKNADGSLTLYIQKDSPGKDKESNWLPPLTT